MEKNLRGQSAYTILDTRNDGVRFTNAKLQALSDEWSAMWEQYETAQEALVEEVVQVAGVCVCVRVCVRVCVCVCVWVGGCDVMCGGLPMAPAAGYCDPLQTLNDLMAKLDVLVRYCREDRAVLCSGGLGNAL